MKSKIFTFLFLGLLFVFASGCGSSAGQEDSSTSGNVGGTLGGSVASSSGGSSSAFFEPSPHNEFELAHLFEFLIPKAFAAGTVCPVIATGVNGTNCSVAVSTATLTYSTCSFLGSPAFWTGSQIVAFTGATPICGSTFPTAMTQIIRTFGAGTTRTSAGNTVVTIDTGGAVTAADTHTYPGGVTITFNGSGLRTGLSIAGIDLVAAHGGLPLFSHTLTTSPVGGSSTPLVFTNGNTISSGTVVTFHNLAKVEGASTFNNVQFSPTCCHPVSGSITTVFSAINGVTPLLPRFVGATETLNYTGCGTATYSGPEGYSGNVTLGHCF